MRTDAVAAFRTELPEAERERSERSEKVNAVCRCLAALLEAEQERAEQEKEREREHRQAAWSREQARWADSWRNCLRLSGW